MALHPTTSTFRKGAIAFAAAAAIFAGSAAKAGDFTHDQCKLIAEATADVFRLRGAHTLSTAFQQSMVNFIAPQGRPTCDGSKEIITPTANDVSAFNTIRTVLLAPPRRISLEQAGLRSVARPTATVGGPTG